MQSITVDTNRDENANGLTQEVNAITPSLCGNDYLDNTLQKEIAFWFEKTKAPENRFVTDEPKIDAKTRKISDAIHVK